MVGDVLDRLHVVQIADLALEVEGATALVNTNFERKAKAALDAGYSKAFLTIVDANVTTLIAALVLFFSLFPPQYLIITVLYN